MDIPRFWHMSVTKLSIPYFRHMSTTVIVNFLCKDGKICFIEGEISSAASYIFKEEVKFFAIGIWRILKEAL